MLQYICFLLAPIPLLFFSPGALTSSSYDSGGGGWEDVGKFLVGFIGIGILAIPSVLLHAKTIEFGAYLFEVSRDTCATTRCPEAHAAANHHRLLIHTAPRHSVATLELTVHLRRHVVRPLLRRCNTLPNVF